MALVGRKDSGRIWRRVLLVVGLFGAALLYGDGVITPAISVLSAVEGLEVAAPGLHRVVVPVTLVVLTGLFAVQRFGTGGIGKFFGPITLVWFVVLVALGLPHIVDNPAVLVALNPWHAALFFYHQPLVAFIALGAVVLCVTGGEALNYFGQGAMLLDNPRGVENPFFLLAPSWAEMPLFLLATAAAIVASQALITAAFSVTKQAIQLGILPRLRILHTSVRDTGQIYVPFVNWGLFVLVVVAVVFFGSSSKLAGAYGVAVTIDMTITTVMTFFVIQPLVIAMLAVPILIQVFFNSALAYWLNRAVGESHNVACPSALIGASNFFELAVAAAISLFGFESGAALATVVGVLIEVPVMLLVVRVVNRSKRWYEAGAGA